MEYKNNYKSIQVNLLKDKQQDLIEWLEKVCEEEGRSYNSFIIQLLKKELKARQESK
jgi:hypothetical protein